MCKPPDNAIAGVLDLSALTAEMRISAMEQIKRQQPTAKLDPSWMVTVTNAGGMMGRLYLGAEWKYKIPLKCRCHL
jgi:hypothetical protein